jgi:hypothetical protein
VKVCSDSAVSIASLEAKIMSVEAHVLDMAAAVEKRLSDFEAELVKNLAGCGSCMFTLFKVLAVYAHRCLRLVL